MIRIARRHPLLVGVMVLSLLLALVFAGRFVVRAVYWEAHREEAVAGWMTVGYVGRAGALTRARLTGWRVCRCPRGIC